MQAAQRYAIGTDEKGKGEAFKVPYKNAGRSARRAIFIPYINIVQDRYHAIAINKAKNSVDICVAPRVPFALHRRAQCGLSISPMV